VIRDLIMPLGEGSEAEKTKPFFCRGRCKAGLVLRCPGVYIMRAFVWGRELCGSHDPRSCLCASPGILGSTLVRYKKTHLRAANRLLLVPEQHARS